jgi:hypothetical protein
MIWIKQRILSYCLIHHLKYFSSPSIFSTSERILIHIPTAYIQFPWRSINTKINVKFQLFSIKLVKNVIFFKKNLGRSICEADDKTSSSSPNSSKKNFPPFSSPRKKTFPSLSPQTRQYPRRS